MSVAELIFYIVAAVTVAGALGVVLARSVIHSALFLILALLAVAGLFILLAAEFLAIVQILIYGGAVTILILFAMMLTRVRDIPEAVTGPQWPIAAVAAALFAGTSIAAILATDWRGETEEVTVIPLTDIGDVLFTTWAIPFLIIALVLFVAMVGAILLARSEEGE
jgi:NADH:ubiquinone oxidoreductase subunit 6 (subunit J)